MYLQQSAFVFQFYGYLSQQQNMMQDYIRTSTYQRAMLSNVNDFLDKVSINYMKFRVKSLIKVLSVFQLVNFASLKKSTRPLVFTSKIQGWVSQFFVMLIRQGK